MGYTTDFNGEFRFNRELDDKTYNLLKGLAETRRMKRKVAKKYGVDGEFYINPDGNYGQTEEDNIVNYNEPPSTQPGLWLGWIPTEDKLSLEWDGGEKFYNYVEWLKYIIKIVEPKGYVLNGEVRFRGEDYQDTGKIIIKDNEVEVIYLK